MAGDPFAVCEEIVRRRDPDRYFAALFAPEAQRRHLFALYALYYELVHAAQAAREPLLVDIRLMWWRETVDLARQGRARDHDVSRALAEILPAGDLPAELFEKIIEARAERSEPFADAAAAEAFGDASVGSLMRLAARVLDVEADEAVRNAAIAYALAGQCGPRFAGIDTAALAHIHYEAARKAALPREALPAVLPATLTPLYLKRSDPQLWRKQIALWRAALRGYV
jgi:hypothetical protein